MTDPIFEDLAVSSVPASAKSSSSVHSGLTEESKLAVDNQDEEYYETPTSDTHSISSSLYEHVEENGRTYHKYKQGMTENQIEYLLPNDELEQNRLDLQHHLCKISLHGRLHLAPLKKDKLKHALDFGTGTGIWAIEFAEKYPNTTVIGSDLSPIQPAFVPQNLTFEIDDMDDEWIYPKPFSYVHARLMAFCFRDPITVFRRAFNALEPGGYFEMQDSATPLLSPDNSIEGTSMQKCWEMITAAGQKIGVDITAAARYKSMMLEVGFVDVKEVVIEWPLGTWAKSEYHKTLGAWFHKDISMGVEGIAMGLFTRVLGQKKEDVEVFIKEVKKDMNDKKIHGYQPFYVVYGRKPKSL